MLFGLMFLGRRGEGTRRAGISIPALSMYGVSVSGTIGAM